MVGGAKKFPRPTTNGTGVSFATRPSRPPTGRLGPPPPGAVAAAAVNRRGTRCRRTSDPDHHPPAGRPVSQSAVFHSSPWRTSLFQAGARRRPSASARAGRQAARPASQSASQSAPGSWPMEGPNHTLHPARTVSRPCLQSRLGDRPADHLTAKGNGPYTTASLVRAIARSQ